jgi:hypothetical protein
MSWLITGAPGSPYDTDAAAYIAAVEAADAAAGQSGGLEEGVKWDIDQFVRGCKADSIWDAFKACCIMIGAKTINGALVPLVGPAPTNYLYTDYIRKTGISKTGNEVAYLDANIANNSALLPQDSRHLSVCVISDFTTTHPRLIGSDDFGSGASLLEVGNNVAGRLSANSSNTFVTRRGTFWGANRANNSTITILNGGNINSYSQSSVTPTSATICVGGSPNSGYASTNRSRFCFYSIGQSIDLALLNSRVSTLVNSLQYSIPS